MTDAIAIIVPVLGRPRRVAEVMANVRDATTAPHRLLFVASARDVEELGELRARGADHIVIDGPARVGDYARKINAGYRATTEPYVFTGADDLRFHPGWDAAALAAFADGVGVVGTDDMGNPRVLRGAHSTHSLVARWYADARGTIDGPGAIYAECYPHEFVDDELVATAKHRNAWAFCARSKVEHLHPNWGKGAPDALYLDAPRRMREGARLHRQRLARLRRTPRAARPRRTPAPTRPRAITHASALPAPVAVIVATFGDEAWRGVAERALASVRAQQTPPAATIAVHGDGLAEARNEGARRATAEWLCFLDADDELEARFLTEMQRALRRRTNAGLLNPAVRFIRPDGRGRPVRVFKPVSLDAGNYLVIGTLVRAELFQRAGGFDPRWEAWEDWALWRRVVALGGRIVQVPRAVYRAHERGDGRNNTVRDREGLMRRIHEDFEAWRRATA